MLTIHNDLPEEGIERAQAILSGDYLFGHVLKLLAKDKKTELLNHLAGILAGNIEGYCRGKDYLVNEEKAELTALALKTAAESGGFQGEIADDYRKAGYFLGKMAFTNISGEDMIFCSNELAEIIERLPRGREIFTCLCGKLTLIRPDNYHRRSNKALIDYNRKIDWRKIEKKFIRKEEKLFFFSGIDRSICNLEERLKNISYSSLPLLDDFCHFLLTSGGKRLRPTLALLAASLIKDGTEKAMPVALALELIHMASLTHDDVIDRAALRRGLPTAWVILGEKMAVQTGDLLLAKVMKLIGEYEDARIMEILADVSMKMCLGEFSQLNSINSKQAFDFEQYFFRIGAKTALLISASCRTGAIAAGLSEEYLSPLSDYGYYLGMVFQIADDMLDLLATEERSGKEQGIDLKRGIITLPVLYALKNSDPSHEIYKLCRKKDISGKDLKIIVCSVKLLGGFACSLETVDEFYQNAVYSIDSLPNYTQKEDLLYLADLIKSRANIKLI